jgi:membrane protease YdiL (CAAX protease family)
LVVTSAAFGEELCFRLYVPLLLAILSVPAPAAMLASCMLFGFLHRYQGWLGVVVTTVIGLVLAFFYLLAGNIILPIGLHWLISFNAVVFRPTVKRKLLQRRQTAA